MRRVGYDGCSIGIPLAEQSKAKLPDVLDFSGEGLGKLMLHAEIETANFRIVQVVGDRTHASTLRRTGRRTAQQRRIGSVRKGRQHRGIRRGDGVEGGTVKVQGIEDHIVECQYSRLGEGS